MRFGPMVALTMLSASVLSAPMCLGADVYPNKSVRLVVPFAPGGGADLIARVIAQKLQEKWGEPVIVDNQGGAGGNIAAEFVAHSKPDGYTVFAYNVANAIAGSVYKKLNYDPIADFTPVTLIAKSPFLLAVSPTLKVGSMRELIALAKAKPGSLNFASSGVGGSSHLAGELLKSMAGIDMVHVPYKGAAPALTDLIAGQVQLMFVDPSLGLEWAKSDKVRLLAAASATRTPLAPDLPTIAESGVPGYEADAWHALALPANAPAQIVQKLNADVKETLGLPDVREKLSTYELVGNTPEAFARFLKAEVVRWDRVAKISGARIEN